MSTITSAASMPQQFSPLSRLQSELASQVSAGTISSEDQSALSTALSDIDAAMRADKPSDGARPSPEDMQAKIDSLIAQEVSDGTLTDDQAAELKSVFASAFKGGPGGPDGPPPGPPPDGEGETASDSSSETDVSQLLSDFLKLLQDSKSSTTSYDSSGESLASKIQSLIVNYQA